MKRLVLLVVAALVASACMKVNLNIDVSDEGSAEVSGILAFNEEFINATVGALGEDVSASSGEDVCAQLAAESTATTPGSDLDPVSFREGGFCGIQFSGSLTADEVADQLNSPDGDSELDLRREGDDWIFEFVIVDQLGAETAGDGDALLEGLDLFGSAEFKVRVRLPGEQVEHNANSIERDGTMVWDVDLADPPDRLFLRTQPGDTITTNGGSSGDDGGGSSTGAVILIVVLVLLALGLAAYYLMRKSGRDATTAEPALSPTEPNPLPTPAPHPPNSGSVSSTPPITTTAVAESPTADPAPDLESANPRVIASPTPEQATAEPIWDPVRRSYVQWDPTESRWLRFDNGSQSWVSDP